MKKLSVAICSIMLVCASQANASAQVGHITGFYIEAGRLLFYMDGQRSPAPPSCAYNDGRWELNLDPTSAAGQMQVSALLTAQASHQTVLVSGINGCNGSDSERVGYIRINPS